MPFIFSFKNSKCQKKIVQESVATKV